jgi:hypothetical protein
VITACDNKRQVDGKMHTVSKWMTALALFGINGAAMAVTYNVDFKAASEEITGAISLAANSLGSLSSSEITGWSLSSVAGDPQAFSISSSDAGSFLSCVALTQCGLTASASKVTFSSLPGGAVTGIVFAAPGAIVALDGPNVFSQCSLCALITAQGSLSGYALPLGTTIASIAAPEMDLKSAAGALTLLLGGLMVLRGRRASRLSAASAG